MKLDLKKADLLMHERAAWTLDEVACYLNCSRRKLDQHRAKADFPRPRLADGFPQYKAGEVMDWFDRQTAAA